MGYNAHSIRTLINHLESGIIFPGCAIMEFGAQEANGEGLREAVADVAAALGMPGIEIPEFPSPTAMSQIFKLLGFEHASIDVNDLHDSIFFDLNTDRVSDHLRNHFDWVNNEGTIEHVANPMNAFKVAHDFTKPNGYITHSTPLMGWVDHGLFYPTPKFLYTLAGENAYKVVWVRAEVNETQPRGPKWYPWLDFSYPDVWLHVAFQKTTEAEFVPPLDHLETDQDHKIRDHLRHKATSWMTSTMSTNNRRQRSWGNLRRLASIRWWREWLDRKRARY